MAGVTDTNDNWKAITWCLSLRGRSDQILQDAPFTFKNNSNVLANCNCLNEVLLCERGFLLGPKPQLYNHYLSLIILTCEEGRAWGNSWSPEQEQRQESLCEPRVSQSKIPQRQPKGVKTMQKAWWLQQVILLVVVSGARLAAPHLQEHKGNREVKQIIQIKRAFAAPVLGQSKAFLPFPGQSLSLCLGTLAWCF